LADQAELERQLAAKEREIERLNARRVKDLERLAEIARERDLLEKRTAEQMAKVAAATGHKRTKAADGSKGARPDVVAPAPGGRLPSAIQSRQALAGGTWLKRQGLRRWWRDTVRQAEAAHGEGRLPDAQVLFEAALVVHATPSLWRQLGHVLREQKAHRPAREAYERALETDPNHGETLFLAGFCAENSGERTVALERYGSAVAREPDLVDRYEQLRDFNSRLAG
jgi:tetratricopeptide (TPR) repeat protein